MKAIYVCEREDILFAVYSEKTRKKIKQNFQISDRVFTREMLSKNSDAEVIFTTWNFPVLTEEEIKNYFPNLKVVLYGAGTVQSFARPYLNQGIKVSSASYANAVPVSEYTLAQIVLANKGFFGMPAIKSLANREKAYGYIRTFPGNYGTKVGLIGAGAIGAMVASMLKNYNLEVYVFDPFLSDEKAKELCVTKTSLEYIFENCQTISNHLANNPQTENMLCYDLFKLMKENAVFINTGRGAQVVEDHLIKALKEKPTRTAVLDVTYPEPPCENHEFYKMDNVILTPHIAGSMGNERRRMGEYAFLEGMRFKNGEKLVYEVTLDMLKTMA